MPSGTSGKAVAERSGTLTVRAIVVKRDRVVCYAQHADECAHYMDDAGAARVLEAFPTLAHHACVNGEGPTLGCVLAHTSVPHVLEHVWIELLVRSSRDGGARFVGTSEWLDESSGLACVQVSYRDDLQALRTFKEALRFVNNTVLG